MQEIWLTDLLKELNLKSIDSQTISNEISTKNPTKQEKLQSNHLLKFHNGTLYIAKQKPRPHLQILKLAEWKRNFSMKTKQKLQLKVVWLDGIDFDMTDFCINSKTILIVGLHQISIAILPLAFGSSKEFTIKSMPLGSCYYSTSQSTIVQAQWHPLSATHSHVLILSKDGCLRMFDTCTNLEEPEQTFYFSSESQKNAQPIRHHNRRGIFSAETTRMISFSIGSGSGWNALTIFGLSSSGDVYSLCPIVPHHFLFSLNQLHALRNLLKTSMELNEKQLHWTERWIQDLIDQAQVNYPESLIHDSLALQIPRFYSKIGICRQGPFLQPVDSQRDASHFLVLNVDVTLFVLGYEDGIIDVWAHLDPLVPCWDVGSEKQQFPQLYALCQFDLNFRIFYFVLDVKYTDMIFVVHAQGIHSFSLLEWIHWLKKNLKEEQCKELEPLKNEFQCILSKMDKRPMMSLVGFDVCSELYIGHCFFVLTNDDEFYGAIHPVRHAIKETSMEHLKATTAYQPIIESPMNLNQMQPSVIAKFLSKSKLMYPESINEETLQEFSRNVFEHRKRIKSMYEWSAALTKRLQAQRQDIESQVKILKLTEKEMKKTNQWEEKCKNLCMRQGQLNQKVDDMIRLLLDRMQPNLSQAEHKWFKELENIQNHIENTLKTNFKMLKLQQEHSTLKPETLNSKAFGTLQLTRIKDALEIEFQLISDLTKRLKHIKIE